MKKFLVEIPPKSSLLNWTNGSSLLGEGNQGADDHYHVQNVPRVATIAAWMEHDSAVDYFQQQLDSEHSGENVVEILENFVPFRLFFPHRVFCCQSYRTSADYYHDERVEVLQVHDEVTESTNAAISNRTIKSWKPNPNKWLIKAHSLNISWKISQISDLQQTRFCFLHMAINGLILRRKIRKYPIIRSLFLIYIWANERS